MATLAEALRPYGGASAETNGLRIEVNAVRAVWNGHRFDIPAREEIRVIGEAPHPDAVPVWAVYVLNADDPEAGLFPLAVLYFATFAEMSSALAARDLDANGDHWRSEDGWYRNFDPALWTVS